MIRWVFLGVEIFCNFIKDNVDDCLSTCQQNDRCLWFSYDPLGQVCELFEDCESLSIEFCPQCISGESSCEPRICSFPGICEVCTISVFFPFS